MENIHSNSQVQTMVDPDRNNDFAQDVLKGLEASPKHLDSKYFYDDKGSVLFQKIMNVPEYYLTRAEEEIFQTRKREIIAAITQGFEHIDVVELGAGDGVKTMILLEELNKAKKDFSYTAIDISLKALLEIEFSLKKELPDIGIHLIENDYLQGLSQINTHPGHRKVLLFLGSNIGNFSHFQSKDLLGQIRKTLTTGDLIMIGFDLKKSPEIILKAYNDSQGVTAAFNLNLLTRINEELDGEFNVNSFVHVPVYDQERGEARSYLQSLSQQDVWIGKLHKSFSFAEGELVHTEISRKYSLDEINELAVRTGYAVIHQLKDSKGYFCDSIWQAT